MPAGEGTGYREQGTGGGDTGRNDLSDSIDLPLEGDMSDKVYTLDEIKSIAVPIARRYNIAAMYLFGSYARGEATGSSDIDFRVDRGGMKNMLELGGLYSDLEVGFDKKLDVLTTQMLTPEFLNSIRPEEVLIYARH